MNLTKDQIKLLKIVNAHVISYIEIDQLVRKFYLYDGITISRSALIRRCKRLCDKGLLSESKYSISFKVTSAGLDELAKIDKAAADGKTK